MPVGGGGCGGLVRLLDVLVRLFADLDRGQSLRHQPAPWSSDERPKSIVAASPTGGLTRSGEGPRQSRRLRCSVNEAVRDRPCATCTSLPCQVRPHACEGRLPGIWFRWVALAPQCPRSSNAASTTQNQSQPLSPRPGVYNSR